MSAKHDLPCIILVAVLCVCQSIHPGECVCVNLYIQVSVFICVCGEKGYLNFGLIIDNSHYLFYSF